MLGENDTMMIPKAVRVWKWAMVKETVKDKGIEHLRGGSYHNKVPRKAQNPYWP